MLDGNNKHRYEKQIALVMLKIAPFDSIIYLVAGQLLLDPKMHYACDTIGMAIISTKREKIASVKDTVFEIQ
jgi:hypothetical protein